MGLLEGQYGTGAGGLCWQACRSDPWLGSFFIAALLAVGAGRNSRRMLECCKRLCWCYICHINTRRAVCVYAGQAPRPVLFVYINSRNDFKCVHPCAYARLSMYFLTLRGCQRVQLAAQCVYIFLLTVCTRHRGTAPGFT